MSQAFQKTISSKWSLAWISAEGCRSPSNRKLIPANYLVRGANLDEEAALDDERRVLDRCAAIAQDQSRAFERYGIGDRLRFR